jgi:hypothetical protein
MYVPDQWETPGLTFGLLSEAAVVAVHEDDDSLKFAVGNELGRFHAAAKGGSAFFGQGRPIFGIAAPPILPSRSLWPLGTGDAGDRFLGTPPAISDDTVIPQIGTTFDARRHSYAFLGGPPPLTDTDPGGSTAFPLPATLAADTNGPDVPDNVVLPETPTTTPPRETEPITPGTSPSTTERPTPTSTPSPGTTLPPRATTTSTPTPTTRPTPTTQPTPTTRPTPTTQPTTTTQPTPTTQPNPTPTTQPAPPPPSTSFVLGNQRDSAAYCLSNSAGGSDNNSCDRLFDLSDIRPGHPQTVNLTLWNVDPDSNTDAVDLRVFAAGACASGTVGPPPYGSGNLCNGLQLKIERYSTAARSGAPSQCVYGCVDVFGGSLNAFAAAHTTMSNGIAIGNGFRRNERAYLVLTVLLPDTGHSSSGGGNDNRYQSRSATLSLTWRMISA